MARKKGKEVDGILLLDKPLGISSNAALQKARYLYNAKKAGHTGSLDPLASGLLPICFGQASKVSAFLLDADKSYQCTLKLGETTSTGDREGDVINRRPVPSLDHTALPRILNRFLGEIEQIPPMHSALKHRGKPLYELARKGIEVERKPRKITIHSLDLVNVTRDTLTLDVTCSKGTYIRTLAEDIGEAIGCGAHLAMLRRTGVSPFNGYPVYTFEQLQELADNEQLEGALLPIDAALNDFPEMTLSDEETRRLRHGLKVSRQQIPDTPFIRLYTRTREFVGMGKRSAANELAAKRLMKTN